MNSQDVTAVLDAICSAGIGQFMGVEFVPILPDVEQTAALNVITLSAVQEQDTAVSRALFYFIGADVLTSMNVLMSLRLF